MALSQSRGAACLLFLVEGGTLRLPLFDEGRDVGLWGFQKSGMAAGYPPPPTSSLRLDTSQVARPGEELVRLAEHPLRQLVQPRRAHFERRQLQRDGLEAVEG